jgi:peptidoglycan-associated lipoprotein
MRPRHTLSLIVAAALLICGPACARRRPPATTQPAPAPTVMPDPPSAGGAPQRIVESVPSPSQPIAEDTIDARSLDDLNRSSPLRPAFFPLDSSDLDESGRVVVSANSEVLKRFPTWVVSVEGHCDERGTAEYNLALGERRAIAVKAYLTSLGVPSERIRTVSYGKEFPFDPGHAEASWSQNRRAHFVITSK